jgi:hypothetical protein
MTRKVNLAVVIILGSVSPAFAQESPTPTLTPATGSTASPTRSVRISFVPPPIEGTISLGIYDDDGKLARVLRQEAELDQFEVGDDGLSLSWDGKDDDGYDLPAGTYHARGFTVAAMKIEQQPMTEVVLGPPALQAPIRVRLVPNPLEKNEPLIVDLDIGYDDENAYLKTADGLPLLTVANIGDVEYAAFANRSDQTLTILLREPTTSLMFKVTPISKMMAFDCGDLELK